MQFLIYSKSIKFLSFKNVIFNGKINIGIELYEENLSLETVEVFMSPSLICDRSAYKYALFYHPGKQMFEYCRSGKILILGCLLFHGPVYASMYLFMDWAVNSIGLLIREPYSWTGLEFGGTKKVRGYKTIPVIPFPSLSSRGNGDIVLYFFICFELGFLYPALP